VEVIESGFSILMFVELTSTCPSTGSITVTTSKSPSSSSLGLHSLADTLNHQPNSAKLGTGRDTVGESPDEISFFCVIIALDLAVATASSA
jgi:hypothetical protein